MVQRPEIAATSELAAGTMVGEYRVTHKLGEGGMGVVYAGVHPEIGKRVAIKILGPQAVAYPDLIRRFKEEARSVNKIRHPNIIDIFAFNQLADGRHYFVMEYLDGESLTDRLARGPMDFAEMRRLLGQICSALHAAHEAGVVHRDLKPDNIWVATQPMSESRIKLLDFGIAKLSDVANASATGSGVSMGTPLYMPPEQGMGRAVDRRADVYALGVLLYQIFAGTLPFQGSSGYEIVLKHVTEPPLPPSRHRPVWPKDMEAIILDCLAKDPAKRPASAKTLGDRIEAAFAAHVRTPASVDIVSTVPRLTTPASMPAAGAPLEMPSQLPNWAKDLPAATPVAQPPGEDAGAPMRGGDRKRAAVLAAAILVAGGAAAALLARRESPPKPATAAVAPSPPSAVLAPAARPAEKLAAVSPSVPVTVKIRIDSDPRGAHVVAKADGTLLGKTPLAFEHPRSESPVEVRLELDGFKPREVTVPLTSDFATSVELARRSIRTPLSRPSNGAPRAAAAVGSPSPPPQPADVPPGPKKDSSSEIIKWRIH